MKLFIPFWKGAREVLTGRDDPQRVRRIADLYWRGLLLAAFVILVFVFLYSIWGLTRILDNLSVALDTSAPPPPALNRMELNAAVSAFDARRAQFEALKTDRSTAVKDPSI